MDILTRLLLLMTLSYMAAITCVLRHYDRRSISYSIKRTKRPVLACMASMVTSAMLYEYVASGAWAVLMMTIIGAALLLLIYYEEGCRAHKCSAIVCLGAIECWMAVDACEAQEPWACIAGACALWWCAMTMDRFICAEVTFLLVFALAYFRRHARLLSALS